MKVEELFVIFDDGEINGFDFFYNILINGRLDYFYWKNGEVCCDMMSNFQPDKSFDYSQRINDFSISPIKVPFLSTIILPSTILLDLIPLDVTPEWFKGAERLYEELKMYHPGRMEAVGNRIRDLRRMEFEEIKKEDV